MTEQHNKVLPFGKHKGRPIIADAPGYYGLPFDAKPLHWLPDENRWEPIAWDDWMAFVAVFEPRSSSIGLPGIAAGIHYFMVCIYDDDAAVNLLPHKYLVKADGRLDADNFAGFSQKEQADYDALMMSMEEKNEQDKERLDKLRRRIWDASLPPRESFPALRRALRKPPCPGSLAHRFFEGTTFGTTP